MIPRMLQLIYFNQSEAARVFELNFDLTEAPGHQWAITGPKTPGQGNYKLELSGACYKLLRGITDEAVNSDIVAVCLERLREQHQRIHASY